MFGTQKKEEIDNYTDRFYYMRNPYKLQSQNYLFFMLIDHISI